MRIILEGNKEDGTDLHSLNAKVSGLSRSAAKTLYYALIYGAFDKKLGLILGAPENEREAAGAQVREKLYKNMPALRCLVEDVERVAKQRRFIYGLDRRILYVREARKAVNLLFQSAGAVVMKKALSITHHKLLDEGLQYDYDFWYCSNSHDEIQTAVRDFGGMTEFVGRITARAITEAGEHFSFNCPLSGEYKIGLNWAETH